jgi:hypothetical protein
MSISSEADSIQADSIYRKYMESFTNPISQSRLEISPTWLPFINEELRK